MVTLPTNRFGRRDDNQPGSARLFCWSAADWSRPATNKFISSKRKRKRLVFFYDGGGALWCSVPRWLSCLKVAITRKSFPIFFFGGEKYFHFWQKILRSHVKSQIFFPMTKNIFATCQKQGGTGFQYFFSFGTSPQKSWKLVPHVPTGPKT